MNFMYITGYLTWSLLISRLFLSHWLAAATTKMLCFLISCVKLEAVNAHDTSEREMTMLAFTACNITCYVFHLWPDKYRGYFFHMSTLHA